MASIRCSSGCFDYGYRDQLRNGLFRSLIPMALEDSKGLTAGTACCDYALIRSQGRYTKETANTKWMSQFWHHLGIA